MPTVAEKRRSFRALHERGCFVIPNPWDVGSALYLQSLGFKALATTSSGAAWSMGYADGAVPLDAMLAHFKALVDATDVPVNADFLDGFAVGPEALAANVARCVATGVAGLSIEDATSDTPTLEFGLAVERIRAARSAIDAAGGDTLLVARSEVFLQKHPEPLKEAIRRLIAFAEAGADCLYAPGPNSRDDVRAIVAAVAPKPVNVLVRPPSGPTVAELADLGVRRVSVGGLLARTAWSGFQRAATELAEHGTFGAFADAASGDRLNALFSGRGGGRGMNAAPSPLGGLVDATPASRPGPVTLAGRFARIEKLDAARHGESLWQAFAGHDAVWTYMAAGPFADGPAFAEWLAARAASADPCFYAVSDVAGRHTLGIFALMEIRPAMRVIEIGTIALSPGLQRTATATEAQYLTARYVFEDLGYRRYEWKCNALNGPSMAAAKRLGFTYEGTFRQHMIVKGRNRDTAWFAITDRDWPAVRAAFEAWLDPANFDNNGKQKSGLAALREQKRAMA